MDLPAGAATTIPAEIPPPVPAEPKRPGVWGGLGTVALYFLLQFGLSLLVGVLIGFALALKAGIEAGLRHQKPDTRAITQLLQTNPDVKVVLTVITIAAAAAVMALLVRQFWPAQWSRADLPGFGFVQPGDKKAYLGAVLLGLAVLFLGGLLTHLLAGSHQIQQDVEVMAGKAPVGLRVLLALLVVCVAPVVEELVFRGVLLSGLASRMRVGWAIVASALIFGCVHLPDFKFVWYPVPALILLGLALAWLRVRTRSLWPSITLHATNNFMAVLAWFLVTPH
ncbi:MAG: CPBP family intramembrane metalloprotease [Rhodanobacteraceae bacterium]|nr:MAG: CPBP family intramembrane metalloprotease [Rhodanobacteraceae bacterium]